MNSSTMTVSESDLALALGVNVDVVRRLRARVLSEKVHYRREGGVYLYAPKAAELLRSHVSEGSQKKEGGPAAMGIPSVEAGAAILERTFTSPGPEKKEGVVRLSLLKAKPSGRHWAAEVVGGEGSGTVVVDVRNGAYFRQGMELEAEPLEGSAGCFVFRGKLPRKPGKW
jgi:hypothetical protein